jgi:O-antigen/teichoic acid export membrane protein
MLQSIKRLTKHTAIYGIGHIVSRSLGFLLLPIHTNILLPGEYRTPALLFSTLAILNVFFSYGMDVAFLRYFILEENNGKKRRIFSTAFWMIMGTSVCFSLLMILIPTPFTLFIFRSSHYVTLIQMAGLILLADALCLLPFLILRAEERSVQFVTLKTLNIAANLGLNILFVVVLRRGVQGIFLSNLIASLFTLATLVPVFIRWLRLEFNPAVLRELLGFGLPYVPSGLALIFMDQVGRFFLDRMKGEEATGIFSASCKLGMFMALVVAAFRFAWHPYFLSTSREENAPEIFARVFTYFLMVTGFIFLILSYFIKDIIRISIFGFSLVGGEYSTGMSIVPVLLLAYIAYGVYIHFIVGVYLKKKTAFLPLATGIGAIVSILANIVLIPKWNIMGAALAIFMAYFSMAVTMYFINQRLYPVPYESGRIFKLICIYGILFCTGNYLTPDNAFLRLLCICSVMPLLWIFRFFNGSERAALRSFLHLQGKA